ncbi:TIGR03663 family protein [bacterium]|nr:TIGR03663 family protein [bacterium]
MRDEARVQQESAEGTSPLRGALPLYLLIAVVALLFRVPFIELRPLHHDEAVNFHFVQEIFAKGYYPYSSENYHGPFYFYLLAAAVAFLGDSVLSFRSVSLLFGVLSSVLPLVVLAPYLRRREIFLAGLFVALSSSGIFHSRYAIHEIALLSCFLSMAAFSYRFFREGGLIHGGGAAISATLCFALKETTPVVGFALFVTCLVTFGPTSVVRRLSNFLLRGRWWLLGSFFLFAALFTGGFQWSAGLSEALFAFAQWFSRGVEDSGHFKPWFYYLKLLFSTEPLLLLALLFPFFGVFPAFRRFLGPQWKVVMFFTLWGGLSLLIHSCIPYKMPWISVQWTGPLALGAGVLLGHLLPENFFSRVPSPSRSPGRDFFSVLLVLLFTLVHGCYGVFYNFSEPYGAKNPFSYVHTSPGMMKVVERVLPLLERTPRAKLLIGVNAYWPLPYYLRSVAKGQVEYRSLGSLRGVRGRYAFFLLEKEVGRDLDRDPCLHTQYFRLSDVEEAYLVTDRCLLDRYVPRVIGD